MKYWQITVKEMVPGVALANLVAVVETKIPVAAHKVDLAEVKAAVVEKVETGKDS